MAGYRLMYLATPYRAFPGGFEGAAVAAARLAARLVDAGVEIYSPVVHGHEICKYSQTAPGDDFWLMRQKPFLRAARGIIVATMPGWEDSSGIQFERTWMEAAGKPEWLLDPDFEALPEDLL